MKGSHSCYCNSWIDGEGVTVGLMAKVQGDGVGEGFSSLLL